MIKNTAICMLEQRPINEMKIARIFPTKTSMSPIDPDAYFGLPPNLFPLEYDEIHISVSFTWDIQQAYWLKRQWEDVAPTMIGGPAIDGESGNGFTPGLYLKKGITITSRGCPKRCSFCFVKHNLIELEEIHPGNIIQDNNILACSRSHQEKVYQMLKKQKEIQFTGGLDIEKLNTWIIEQLRGLRIKQLFFSYDRFEQKRDLIRISKILKKYFNHRNYLRCYVFIVYKNDTIEKALSRLIRVYELGFLPFSMLYRNEKGEYPQPEKEWRKFNRTWERPAAFKTWLKENGIIK